MISKESSAGKKLAYSSSMWKLDGGYGVLAPVSHLDGLFMVYLEEIANKFRNFPDFDKYLKKRKIGTEKIKIDVSGCRLRGRVYGGTAIVGSRSKCDTIEYKIRVTDIPIKNPEKKSEAFRKMRFMCKCDYTHYQLGVPVPEEIKNRFNDRGDSKIEMVMCPHSNATMSQLVKEKNCEDFGIFILNPSTISCFKFLLEGGFWKKPDYEQNEIIKKHTLWLRLLESILFD